MAKHPRKFGEIPDWAKKGPVTLRNYDLRCEWYGAKIKQWGDNWPFLSKDPDFSSTADEAAWERYFLKWLHGFPPSYQLYRRGVIKYYNLPEARPELFEPAYGGRDVHG